MCIGFSAISFVVSIIGKFIYIDVFFDQYLSPEEKEPEFDPIAPDILECLDDKIRFKEEDKESRETETLNEDEENMISEEFKNKLKEYDYDFNKKDKIIIVKEKKENNIINNKEIIITNIKEKNNEKEDNKKETDREQNVENDVILTKKEEISSKKYKITNLGRNLLNLPENYSTDIEDEYKFISLINETNEDYELAIDSKTTKVYAKIVSIIDKYI